MSYFNDYYNYLVRHLGGENPRSLMEALRIDICKEIKRIGVDVDFFTEEEVRHLLRNYVPDSSFLRYVYNLPTKPQVFRNKSEEMKYLAKTRKILKELKNSTLSLMWWNFTSFRDDKMRKQEGIEGKKYVRDEIWLEEQRKRKLL